MNSATRSLVLVLFLSLSVSLSPSAVAQPDGGVSPEQQAAINVARAFFQSLLQADARGAAHRSAAPFFLEAQKVDSEDQLIQELSRHLRAKRTDLLTLYGVEVLTLGEMEQRYGKAPARLSSWPLRDRNATFAVANISGWAAVAMLKNVDGQWRVFAYHD